MDMFINMWTRVRNGGNVCAMPRKKPASERRDQAAHILFTRDEKRALADLAKKIDKGISDMCREAILAYAKKLGAI